MSSTRATTIKDSLRFHWRGSSLLYIVILIGVASQGLCWSPLHYRGRPLLLLTRSGKNRCSYRREVTCLKSALGTPGKNDDKHDGVPTDKKIDSTYKFGDITRGVLGKLQNGVNSLTGKSKYEFGDLSRWLDEQAKEGAVKLDQSVKKQVQQFTQRNDYQFGDITRELIRRFQDGEYKAEDIWLFLRIALIIGRHVLPPVAATLPVKVLMELVELSMAQSVSEDVTNILTGEVDKRMKQWIIGDRNYKLGDISTKILSDQTQLVADFAKQAAVKFTEKDVYEVGDITKQLWKKYRESTKENTEGQNASVSKVPSSSTATAHSDPLTMMEKSEFDAFEAWDKNFLASNKRSEDASSSDAYFKQWDEALLEANRNGDSTATLINKQIDRANS